MTVSTILLIVAAILFVISAIGVSSRINLVAAGLACVTLALLVGTKAL